MKYLVLPLAVAALANAQAPAVSIRPNNITMSVGRIGVPVLGYAAGPGPLDLRLITGTAESAQLSSLLPPPANARQLLLPPREHYALVELDGNEPLSLWLPLKAAAGAKTEPAPIAGAFAHPDLAVFSARGESAVLINRPEAKVQIVRGLPAEPVVVNLPGVAGLGGAVAAAVSDDGAAAILQTADSNVWLSLAGAPWRSVPQAFGAGAMQFVPNTHSLVAVDTAREAILLLSELDQPSPTAKVLAQPALPNRLAFTKEGDRLLAASQRVLWTIDWRAGSVVTATQSENIQTLLPLRDGRTFLLGASPALAVQNVALESEPVNH